MSCNLHHEQSGFVQHELPLYGRKRATTCSMSCRTSALAPAVTISRQDLPRHVQHLLLHYRNARSCNLHHYLNVCIAPLQCLQRRLRPAATATYLMHLINRVQCPDTMPELPHKYYVGGYCQQQLQLYEHLSVPSKAPPEAATPAQRLPAASNNW